MYTVTVKMACRGRMSPRYAVIEGASDFDPYADHLYVFPDEDLAAEWARLETKAANWCRTPNVHFCDRYKVREACQAADEFVQEHGQRVETVALQWCPDCQHWYYFSEQFGCSGCHVRRQAWTCSECGYLLSPAHIDNHDPAGRCWCPNCAELV